MDLLKRIQASRFFLQTFAEKNGVLYFNPNVHIFNMMRVIKAIMAACFIFTLIFYYDSVIALILFGIGLAAAFFASPPKSTTIIDSNNMTISQGKQTWGQSDFYALIINSNNYRVKGVKQITFSLSVLTVNNENISDPVKQQKNLKSMSESYAKNYTVWAKGRADDAAYDKFIDNVDADLSFRLDNSVCITNTDIEFEVNQVAEKIANMLQIPIIDVISKSSGVIFYKEPKQLLTPFNQYLNDINLPTLLYKLKVDGMSHSFEDGKLTIEWKTTFGQSSICMDAEKTAIENPRPLVGGKIYFDTSAIRLVRIFSASIYSIISISYADDFCHIYLKNHDTAHEVYHIILHFLAQECSGSV